MTPPFRVLWVCTANACRSQMAEAILRQVGGDRFVSRSAGAHPVGRIHPLAEAGLSPMGIPIVGQHSKGFEEVRQFEHDVIITLCDSAACELPVGWKGDPVRVHWGLADPVTQRSSEGERQAAAVKAARTLRERIERLVALPLETMNREQLGQALVEIASI
jgi:arsenate reductase